MITGRNVLGSLELYMRQQCKLMFLLLFTSLKLVLSVCFGYFVFQFTFFVTLLLFSIFLKQNESSSNTTEKETEFENKLEMDRSKRFDYLLKQTEIFTHFMTNTGPKSPNKVKTVGRPKKQKDISDAGE